MWFLSRCATGLGIVPFRGARQLHTYTFKQTSLSQDARNRPARFCYTWTELSVPALRTLEAPERTELSVPASRTINSLRQAAGLSPPQAHETPFHFSQST